MVANKKPQAIPAFDNHRLAMIELMRQIDAEAGIVAESDMTPEKLQARMQAHGIRPEENGASQELLKMRYRDESVEG